MAVIFLLLLQRVLILLDSSFIVTVFSLVSTSQGLQREKIPVSSLSSSSFYNEDFTPEKSRLNFPGAWKPAVNDSNPWFEIKVNTNEIVTHLATQGHGDTDEWVTTFTVAYSMDRETFLVFKNKIFSGNQDRNSIAINVFPEAIRARYIRIYPKTYHVGIAMRLGIFKQAGSFKGPENTTRGTDNKKRVKRRAKKSTTPKPKTTASTAKITTQKVSKISTTRITTLKISTQKITTKKRKTQKITTPTKTPKRKTHKATTPTKTTFRVTISTAPTLDVVQTQGNSANISASSINDDHINNGEDYRRPDAVATAVSVLATLLTTLSVLLVMYVVKRRRKTDDSYHDQKKPAYQIPTEKLITNDKDQLKLSADYSYQSLLRNASRKYQGLILPNPKVKVTHGDAQSSHSYACVTLCFPKAKRDSPMFLPSNFHLANGDAPGSANNPGYQHAEENGNEESGTLEPVYVSISEPSYVVVEGPDPNTPESGTYNVLEGPEPEGQENESHIYTAVDYEGLTSPRKQNTDNEKACPLGSSLIEDNDIDNGELEHEEIAI